MYMHLQEASNLITLPVVGVLPWLGPGVVSSLLIQSLPNGSGFRHFCPTIFWYSLTNHHTFTASITSLIIDITFVIQLLDERKYNQEYFYTSDNYCLSQLSILTSSCLNIVFIFHIFLLTALIFKIVFFLHCCFWGLRGCSPFFSLNKPPLRVHPTSPVNGTNRVG